MAPEQVEQFLTTLNDAWLGQDYVTLAGLYDSDVVLLPPDAGAPIVGRDAVIESYQDFHAACRVDDFKITSAEHFEFAQNSRSFSASPAASDGFSDAGAIGATIMAHMRFRISYQLLQQNGDPLAQSEQGLEVYTLIEQPEGMRIVWRAQFAL